MSIMGDRGQIAKDGKAMRLAQRPLYAQVREVLVRRLVDGVWSPGEALPSEMELAAELDVSQGTVRKALDSMTAATLGLAPVPIRVRKNTSRSSPNCSRP